MSESASTKSYFYREWSELGNLLTTTSGALAQAEKQAFEMLREEVKHTFYTNAFSNTTFSKVVSSAALLRTNASAFDEIDVAISFATLAEELKLSRPTLTEE